MEVRINKEVRDYQESLFFGLSLRQFLFALLAVAVAVGVYFGLHTVVGNADVGWLCVLAFSQIFHALSRPAFGWLLAGGIIYTIGGIIYALKVPLFDAKHKNFGSHEIFHLFVMGGSACHFVTMFLLAGAPV